MRIFVLCLVLLSFFGQRTAARDDSFRSRTVLAAQRTRGPHLSTSFRDQQCEDTSAPPEFDATSVLRELYGSQFDVNDKSGKGGIVVLGMHNSGTSMVTRLVMLLGAFGGDKKSINISGRNRLKFWEQRKMFHFHNEFFVPFVDRRFKPYHAVGFDYHDMQKTMKDHEREAFECFAKAEMNDLGRHEPFVTKDPRMGLVMDMWKPHIPNPVCLFVLKDPIKNVVSLAHNDKKSAKTATTGEMTAQRWLDLWENTFRNSLEACKGVPTVLFNYHDILPDVKGSVELLKERLEAAGVVGLHMPSESELQKKFGRYITSDRPQQRRLMGVDGVGATDEVLEEANEREERFGEYHRSMMRHLGARTNARAVPKGRLVGGGRRPVKGGAAERVHTLHPSASQVGLEAALVAYLQRFDGGQIKDYTTVAEGILELADTLGGAPIFRMHDDPAAFHTH